MTSTELFPTGFGGSLIGLGPAVVRMGRWTALSVWMLALALGLMVLWRRIGGDTLGAVPWSAGLLSGVLVAVVAAGTRVLWLVDRPAEKAGANGVAARTPKRPDFAGCAPGAGRSCRGGAACRSDPC